jgi:Leucine-rich repeat (LRR) protein
MSSLEFLSLSGNSIGPDIPTELGTLPKLQELDASQCLFEALPDIFVQDASVLAVVNVGGNLITSAGLPKSWTSTALTSLDLSNNQLAIPFPVSELADLVNLQYLYMSECELIDSLLADVGSLAALQELDLDTNLLEGTLPPELGSISTLTR